MIEQPGYDAMATAYDEAFPTGYASPLERHLVGVLADDLLAEGSTGPVLDIGCGTGHVTADLAQRGLDVVGVDPSAAMLEVARRRHPGLRWVLGDATLTELDPDVTGVAGILARFSLIHVDPDQMPGILDAWVARLRPDARVMVAFQGVDDPASPVLEFDHTVARAWRWHPDAMSEALCSAGLTERWRLVTRPDASYRFPLCHLLHELAG